MLGSRVGSLWLTYHLISFHSSILGFTKTKVWSLNDVTSVWKTDSLIGGGLSMNVENHGEISFTIPTNCDNVYTVLDQLLRMHREDREMKRTGNEREGEGESKNTKDGSSSSSGSSRFGTSSDATKDGSSEVPEQTAKWF